MHYDGWESARGGSARRAAARGRVGVSGVRRPGGVRRSGVEDFRFNAVINEEAARRGLAAFALVGFAMQNDVDRALPEPSSATRGSGPLAARDLLAAS